MQQYDLRPLLDHIPPSQLDYQEWITVGMALHQEGYPCEVWDSWSRDDNRYKPGVCDQKWKTFGHGDGTVTGGTIYEFAKRFGWSPADTMRTFDWEDEIEKDDDPTVIIKDKAWVESEKVDEAKGESKQELITYLEMLFKPDECVGFVMQSAKDEDGKYRPASAGRHTFTAGQIIERLKKNDSIEEALEKYDHAGGAWIRFNPLDGKGVKNDNVAAYRFALVESDGMSIDEQYGLYKELNLPIAALVYSAGKSLHAIVRIDAYDKEEYRKRVDYLYDVCEKNGIVIDKQNKNPSRMSRMPGVVRYGTKRQRLIATNIGAKDYTSWVDWLNEKSDDLPEMISWEDIKNNLPPLADELVEGVLRQGHKMLISGASKAGKSFLLTELAVAIASGGMWLKHRCKQGKVLYINMEIDPASFFDRVDNVINFRGSEFPGDNLKIWNLRGEDTRAERLIPRLIHRIKGQGYFAIIIDPLYKINQGDENSAAEVGAFFNQLDKICKQLGASVILCHHHSKGSQGAKNSADRSSGSGVFARDPDAVIDLLEIEPRDVKKDLPEGATAWRVSFTLREFPTPKPYEITFEYPGHLIAEGLEEAGEKYGADAETKRQRGHDTQSDTKETRIARLIDFILNWDVLKLPDCDRDKPKISDAVEYFKGEKGFSQENIKHWIKNPDYGIYLNTDKYLMLKDVYTMDE